MSSQHHEGGSPEEDEELLEWRKHQFEIRAEANRKLAEQERQEIIEHKNTLWEPFRKQMKKSHELNIAWKSELDIFHWERVLEFPDLTAIRVTGHPLDHIPESIPEKLPALHSLSFISAKLTRLPENIGVLALTELILTKNGLETLPESITDIVSLRMLDLSSNKLTRLPKNIGNLKRLERFMAEKNNLVTLPDSFGKLKCRSANFNLNKLESLPDSIENLASLTSLSLNKNSLTSLPESIGYMPSLKVLSVCNNQLTAVPNSIGSLLSLTQLRLDWNRIRELPLSFRSLQSTLKLLRLEQNPMIRPPVDVVSLGTSSIMTWLTNSYEHGRMLERRAIALELQDALGYLATQFEKSLDDDNIVLNPSRKKLITSLYPYFEPNTMRVVKKDLTQPFFAYVPAYLWTKIIPRINELRANDDKDNGRKKKKKKKKKFKHSKEEVDDALLHLSDQLGKASISKTKAVFRQCACMDSDGTSRKVCVPPIQPFRCERHDVTLFRMKLLTAEEYKESQAAAYLERRVKKFVEKIRVHCEDFISSEDGIKFFKDEATALATSHNDAIKQKRENELRQKRDAEEKERKKKKYYDRKAKLIVARAKHVAKLEIEIEKLEKKIAKLLPRNNNSKKVEKLMKKLDLAKEIKEDPPEDFDILEIDLIIEAIDKGREIPKTGLAKVTSALRGKKTAELESSSSEDGNDGSNSSSSSDDDDDGGSSEDDENNSEKSDSSSESSEDSSSEEEEMNNESVVKKPPTTSRDINEDMPELDIVVDFKEAAVTAVEKDVREELVPMEQLVAMYDTHLKDAYMKEKVNKVKNKVIIEYVQMRNVMKRWLGSGARIIFESWRDHVRKRIMTAKKTTMRQEKLAALELESRRAAHELGRFEARKWVQKIDEFSDQPYYEHTETGEISWEPPAFWSDDTVPALNLKT